MPDQVSINLNELRNAVDVGLRTRRYLDYWESSEWADAASPIADAFGGFVANSPSQELVELIQRAVGYMVKVILHADDSNGEIGGLISDLLEFHGVACDAGVADPVKLARWMVRFTIDDQDFFVLDPKVVDHSAANSILAAGTGASVSAATGGAGVPFTPRELPAKEVAFAASTRCEGEKRDA